MAHRSERIKPERLCDAASAAMEAMNQWRREHPGAGSVSPALLLGRPDQPAALCDFTREEVDQGWRFLKRLGYAQDVDDTR